MTTTARLLSAAALIALAACGGSSGTKANHPPAASAGADRAAQVGELVMLDAGASTDEDGDALTYSWSMGVVPAGSTAALASGTGRQTAFMPDRPGSYVVVLVASDGRASSEPALLVVSASLPGAPPPVAVAGADLLVTPGQAVALNGAGSYDLQSRPLSFSWVITSQPAGAAPTLANPGTATPTFSSATTGTYLLTLTVTALGGGSASDVVTVTVGDPSPVASAGPNRSVPVGQPVTVQGSGGDPDGTPVTFAWVLATRPDGSAATLAGAATATPTFTPDLVGTYVVRLTVSNASGEATSTATITAANPPPVSDAGGNRSAYLGDTVTLDAHASDPDGEPLTFTWTLVNRPQGSAAALSSASTATTTLVPDVAGQYLISLLVSDPSAALPEQVITVTAYPAMAALAHRVLDAEYSKALDAIVMIDEAPSALYVYDPVAKTEKKVLLPLTPTAVSVSPDGLTAAVGHNAYVTHVDLSAGTIIKTWPVTCDVFDVVLAGNGYAYAMPRIDQWVTLHSLNLSTGVETTSGTVRAGTRARLHPGGEAIYGANNGLSPSDIEKYSITGGTGTVLYDSPYHGDYAMCGDVWPSEDGARLFTACGNVFRATSTRATDMTYAGALEATTAVRHLADSAAAGEVLAVPAVGYYGNPGDDTSIRVFAADFLTRRPSVPVSPFLAPSGAFAGHGRFVFYGADGTRRWALVQADPTSAMLKDFAVLGF